MILEEIKSKLIKCDHQKIAKQMGYGKVENFKKAINTLFDSGDVTKWLRDGYFDMKYSSLDFLVTLTKLLSIDMKILYDDIIEASRYNNEFKRFQNCMIFIETNFKRKNEPIHVLAIAEGLRRINLNNKERFFFKNIDEIIQIISIDVRQHYSQNQGVLPLWGTIEKYVLHLFDKVYIFDTKGNIILSTDSYDRNHAYLTL